MSPLAFIVLFPLLGAVILSFNPRMSDRLAAIVGVGSVGLAALFTVWVDTAFLAGNSEPFVQRLWTWVSVGNFTSQFSFYLDGLSVTMIGVVTGVGFLIHLFASWYMREDLAGERGYARFFAYMNLFVFSMLVLVLGNNLLLIYLGWEGVGMCSYLLIGYYYKDHANAWAAFKAFIVTRVGDVFLAIGLFILFTTFGTLNVQELLERAPEVWAQGDPMATLAALMLLGGAVGKSAQLPLQTWLPDAMAGPTPVSALIHAATMVTAGVYLIARMHTIFELAPGVLTLVAVVGAATLLLAGFTALVQTDIKRVLAYSTMSQIGYMFLALGVQAWDAAIFHLMTHAFFKALLFLTSGSVIIACHHEQDMFKMGGLRKTLKLPYVCFLIGGAALAALPIISAGFYSKDVILEMAFVNGYNLLWLAGLLGAFITAIYTFRMIFVTFHGEQKIEPHAGRGIAHHLPLIVLAILSTFLGALIQPPLGDVLPAAEHHPAESLKLILAVVSSAVAIVGLGIAAGLFLGKRDLARRIAHNQAGSLLWRFWYAAWGFDWLYDRLFVKPWQALTDRHRTDWVNALVNMVPRTAVALNGQLALTENGKLRWYALGLFAGGTLLLALLLLG